MGALGYSHGYAHGGAFGALAPPVALRAARADYTTLAGDPVPSTYCVGDLEPDILFLLTETRSDGTAGIQPIDLTDAAGVTVRWRKPDGTLVTRFMGDGVLGGVAIENALLGHVRLTWRAGDTDQEGRHRAQVRIFWPSGEIQTVPSALGDAYSWTVTPLV